MHLIEAHKPAAVDVAILAQNVENMKTVLNSKIGANDVIMTSVTDQLGSLTRKLDEFYAQLMENDSSIKKVISDNEQVIMITLPKSPTSK